MTTQPHDHILHSRDEDRARLLDEIMRMGEMSAAQLEAALDVVERRDDKAAARIIENDDAIDALEQQVGHEVMRLALKGPLARDLRELLAFAGAQRGHAAPAHAWAGGARQAGLPPGARCDGRLARRRCGGSATRAGP